ncbi:hypothetical protein D7X88_05255 [bacterium C-53]|nr:hypothetical protein [Lachnospiraceae bacterium]NBI02628.1 hypothetical protein [Lachnospiraceae bacterium]RKJ11268.1 hypothetical protein D7X88_05255 [bacterium C-53]
MILGKSMRKLFEENTQIRDCPFLKGPQGNIWKTEALNHADTEAVYWYGAPGWRIAVLAGFLQIDGKQGFILDNISSHSFDKTVDIWGVRS